MKALDVSIPDIPANDHKAWREHLAHRLMEAEQYAAELEAELEVKKAQVNDAVTSGAKLANAVGRLVACKGRYHAEQNYNQLVKALEAYRENR